MRRGVPISAPDPYVFREFVGQQVGGNRQHTAHTLVAPALVGGENTAVLVIAGQSNATNIAPSGGPYTVTQSKNHQMSIYDGGVYATADPLLGTQFQGMNMWTRVADSLITDGEYARTILVNCAVGGTLMAEWATDASLYQRVIVACRRCDARGYTIKAICWQHGESDNSAGTTQNAYTNSFNTFRGLITGAGYSAPWIVGKSTYVLGATSAAVRAAQAALVDNVNIFAGGDTDSLTGADRQADDLHLSHAGLTAAAALWNTAIKAAL